MSNEQISSGAIVPSNNMTGQQQGTIVQRMQGVPSVNYSSTQQSQQQQMLNALSQGGPMDAASQLLMNPHTAAVVATVAAAAAQQMAQHQQHQQQQHQHQQHHVVNHQHQAQAMHASPPAQSSQQHHSMVTHNAPPAATPPSNVASMASLPPHLAALLGMPQPAPNVYSHGAPVAPVVSAVSSAPTSAMLSNMQNWKHDQLESHVKMLRETNQAIPQPVAMLLADARRKEEKRTAKRVANRKSACTSRARKKALVEEMTRTNARLKRQALILALLPDLVIAITTEGEITFCSAQVERVLRHKIGDLIGANLMNLLVPASAKAMRTLIGELVAAERAAAGDAVVAPAAAGGAARKEENGNENGNGNASGQSSSTSSNGAAIVSDQSFPLSVVKVVSQQSSGAEESSLSTSNNGKGASVVPASSNGSAPQSANSSLGNDETAAAKGETKGEKQPSSDENSLASSSDAKNLRKANENLNRNVRWHNEKLTKSQASKAESTHKDDVTGEAVTPNNASARLSSLQHRPTTLQEMLLKKKMEEESTEEENSSNSSDSLLAGVEEKKKKKAAPATPPPVKNGNGNSSDESGYRESNESAREDTESSASDSSSGQHGRRPKPLAPTCNICLIRDDLTTIWCEVTSSIRTRSLKDEADDANPPTLAMPSVKGSKSSKAPSSDDVSEAKTQPSSQQDEIKELLLCLRPIRDGEQKVNENMRFVPFNQAMAPAAAAAPAAEEEVMISVDNNTTEPEEPVIRRPVKKRPVQQPDTPSSAAAKVVSSSSDSVRELEMPTKKKARKNSEDDPEKSVVESLMLMGGKC